MRRATSLALQRVTVDHSAAFRYSPTPMFVCEGAPLTIVDCNEAAADAIGASADRIIGSALGTLCDIQERRDGTNVFCEGPTGEQFVVTMQALPSGQTLAVLQLCKELRALENAREDAQRFRLLTLATNDPVWEWDLRERTMWWNSAFEERFGFAPSRENASMDFWLSRVPEYQRDEIADGMTRLLFSTTEEHWSLEHQFRREDGSYAIVLERAYVVRDAAGNPLTMIASMLDLSERRAEEEERRQLESALRRSERLSAMGSLVAGVAHEVRNPLFAISAICDAFQTEHGDRPETARYFTFLRGELGRLTTLMQELLDYAKPATTKPVRGRIEELMLAAVRREQHLLKPEMARVVAETESGIPEVLLDSGRIMQIFQNLIQNALQHAPAGGTVRLTARAVNGGVECEVRDNGPGFPADAIDRVFDPFFTRRRGGTGLGLAIVQRIVEDHRGTIVAKNDPAGGAVVTMRFPSAPEES